MIMYIIDAMIYVTILQKEFQTLLSSAHCDIVKSEW